MAMIMTTKSGRWSDPSVWSSRAMPGSGDMAHILSGHEIIYDVERDAILSDVMSEMGSKLTWGTAKETRLRVNTIMLNGIMDLTDRGVSATPGKPKHEIVFHPIAGKEPGAGTGLGLMCMGPTRIHGAPKAGHLRSANMEIAAGATTITLTGLSKSGWRVGDTIIILGTNYLLPVSTDPQYTGPKKYYSRRDSTYGSSVLNTYQFGEDEERQIVAIDGDTITLDSVLTYTHKGMTGTLKDGKVVTIMPVVGNVSRSIRFRTATAAEDGALDPGADITVLQKRAHSMFMRQPDVDLRYFETKNMGRTSTDPSLYVAGLPDADLIRDVQGGVPLADPNNVRGRYAIHLHWCGGPHNAAPLVPLIGATAWAPIREVPIPGWAITQHGTRAAIEDCVTSNVRGAGIVSELGNETGQWANCLSTGNRGDGDTVQYHGRGERYVNHNGAVGIAFENQSRAILMHGNIAGSSQYAYMYWAQKVDAQKRSPRDVDLPLLDGYAKGANSGGFAMDEAVGIFTPQIPPFIDNEAWACRVGFGVVHRLASTAPLANSDMTPMLADRFHCVNVPFAVDVPQYSNTYFFKDCLHQGPLNMMTSSQCYSFGNVSWNWNISNCHMRNYRNGITDTGTGLNYNGFFIDVTHENVTNPWANGYLTVQKANIAAKPEVEGVMGPWEDNPVQPTDTTLRSVRVRSFASIDRASLPLPYPLEPLGRKLPANKPDGTPYPPVNYGDKPYFVQGDGTNGANSTDPVAMELTLTAGSGRSRGRVYGIIRDSVGDLRWPDHQSSESFPVNIGRKTYRHLGKLTPEQLVQRHGCWNDGGTWKCRAWFPFADRASHVKAWFHIDHPLAGFTPEFLALHDHGHEPTEPDWPDKLEIVGPPRPLTPISRNLRFLSRTRLEAVDGRALAHRVRPNEVLTKITIVGGNDAILFSIHGQYLVWAGAQPAVRSTPYQVILRATDTWGNTVEASHDVHVIASTRVSDLIEDNFDRADENLEANPAYLRLTGAPGTLIVKSNTVGFGTTTAATYNLGSLGTSEQEVSANINQGYGGPNLVLFRMVDENNWLGFGRGAELELWMCIGGVRSRLAIFNNTTWITVTCTGRKLVAKFRGGPTNEPSVLYPKTILDPSLRLLDMAPLAEPGSLMLPENAPLGVNVGLFKSATFTQTNWLDMFSAKALAG